MKLTFGKYRDQTIEQVAEIAPDYLDWILTTDIPNRNPGMTEAIKLALAANDETPDTILAIPTMLPDLSYTIRGGGRMQDGVIIAKRITENGDFDLGIKTNDISRSGRSGTLWFEEPRDDGAYTFVSQSGSIANHTQERMWMVLREGQWYDVQDRRSALATIRGATLDTPENNITA